jgi:hypothetical protein
MSENFTKQKSIRFDADLQAELERLAKAERRSFSSQVTHLVEVALSQRSDQHQPVGAHQ